MGQGVQMKCQFCGSKKIRIETPYIDPITKEKQLTYCCRAQAQNQQYVKDRYLPGEEPTQEEVGKWKP